jgi:hypothetical protein
MDADPNAPNPARRHVNFSHCLERRSGRLAPGVVHELNTPAQYIGDNLHFIATVLQQLLDNGTDDSQTNARILDACNAVTESIAGLDDLRGILNSFRWYVTPSPPSWNECDLNATVEHSLQVLRNRWKYDATVDVDLETNLAPIRCHPDVLKTAVTSLLLLVTEAIQTARPTGRDGSSIRITTTRIIDATRVHCEITPPTKWAAPGLLRPPDDCPAIGSMQLVRTVNADVLTLDLPDTMQSE